MVRLELRDLVIRPGVEAVALDLGRLDACGRAGAQQFALDRKPAERTQGREPAARAVGRLGVEQRRDPLRWQECERAVAVRLAKAVKDAAPHASRAGTLGSKEFLRVEILSDDVAHSARLDG